MSPARPGLPKTGVILYRNVNTEFILKKIIKIKKTKKTKKRKKPQKTTYMYIGLKSEWSGCGFFVCFFFYFGFGFFCLFGFIEEV